MTLSTNNLGNLSGTEILMHSLEAFAEGRLEVKRPKILYPSVFPAQSFNTSLAPGSLDYSKIYDDYAGTAAWRAEGSADVNTISTVLGKTSAPIFMGAIAGKLDIRTQEQNQILASRGFSQDLTIRTPQVMKLAVDYFIEKLMFFGDNINNAGGNSFYPGMLDHPIIPLSTVPVGASGFSEWTTKTPDEIIFDMQQAIIGLYVSTNTVYAATHLYLPVAQYGLISGQKAGVRANDETILNYVSKNNLSKTETGQDLIIRPIRYLSGAGVGGTDRMLLLNMDQDNFMIGQPVDFNILDVQKVDYSFKYLGHFEVGPLHLPYPTFAAYYDGI